MTSLTVECQARIGRGGRNKLGPGESSATAFGRVPRVARLMALAIRFDQLIRTGEVRDYADLARLGHVSRARITQIMNLILLAPDIQEQILLLPLIERGREPLNLGELQSIAMQADWRKQRRLWKQLSRSTNR